MTRKALQTHDQVSALLEPVAEVKAETTTPDMLGEHSLTPVATNNTVGMADDQDILPNDSEDKDREPIGRSSTI